ncbi:hypothetical protein [Aliikangiella sp. IMCC44359]|uniref:hypothetical protein n=1 Tax=Aliikangiella sp. IMCC44359 TaxID=3459125 RepID=UPI00403AFE74
MNKSINAFAFLLLFFLVAACSEKKADLEKQKTYEKQGLSFTYPANWKVTEDSVNEGVRFIFIESPGAAITKIEVYPKEESFDLKEFVKLDIDAIKQGMPGIFDLDDNTMEQIETFINGISFGGYKYEYNVSVVNIDIPHISEFYLYSSELKNAYITNQVAVEDFEKVKEGFRLVLSTFNLI